MKSVDRPQLCAGGVVQFICRNRCAKDGGSTERF
uniref:Uncharacterized protein n=1 Tax=Oryza meridionalis TaxID=40149 RepID=A0A0E0EAS3_9ORYZ